MRLCHFPFGFRFTRSEPCVCGSTSIVIVIVVVEKHLVFQPFPSGSGNFPSTLRGEKTSESGFTSSLTLFEWVEIYFYFIQVVRKHMLSWPFPLAPAKPSKDMSSSKDSSLFLLWIVRVVEKHLVSLHSFVALSLLPRARSQERNADVLYLSLFDCGDRWKVP